MSPKLQEFVNHPMKSYAHFFGDAMNRTDGFKLISCVQTHVHACIYSCIFPHTNMQMPHFNSGIFFYGVHLILRDKSLLVNEEFTVLARLATKKITAISLSLTPVLGSKHRLLIYPTCAGYLNSGSHDYTARTLPNELSPSGKCMSLCFEK